CRSGSSGQSYAYRDVASPVLRILCRSDVGTAYWAAVLEAQRPMRCPDAHTPQHSKQSLAELVDSYQASGRYALTREDALRALGITEEALKKAVQRLVAKHRLAVPHRGFYVIVPLEYRDAGAPPASWFIDDLMKFHGQPYYVGLLT